MLAADCLIIADPGARLPFNTAILPFSKIGLSFFLIISWGQVKFVLSINCFRVFPVTDNVSISYGVETLETPNDATDVDQEVTGIKASYTSGGMTLGLAQIETDNAGFSNAATEDDEMWEVSLSFAF